MKTMMGSSTRGGRLLWPLEHNLIARGRLRMKANCSSRRFSALLASTSGCTNLRQNRWHDPAHLPRGDDSPSPFPRTIAGLPQSTSQTQLIHDNAHDLTPAFKLLWATHMDVTPEQILLEVAIAMFVRKTLSIQTRHLRQGNTRWKFVEADKPALTRVAFAVFRPIASHAENTHFYFAGLSEMQPTPPADRHQMPLLIVTHPDSFGFTQGLLTTPLQEGTIQRRSSFLAFAHRVPIEFAIAFEANEHLTAQRFAGTQKVCSGIPPIGQND